MTKTLTTPLIVPEAIRRKAGLRNGQEIEFRVSGHEITILPKSDEVELECTPAQRRAIDARLREAEKDISSGQLHGPFTATEASDFIEQLAAARAARKTKRPRR